MLGPIDRVLGFGFGGVKGMIIVMLGFSILVLGYDTVWGAGGRPTWITQARTYPFVNASSEALVTMIAERRREAAEAEAEALGRQVMAQRRALHARSSRHWRPVWPTTAGTKACPSRAGAVAKLRQHARAWPVD